MASVRRPRVSPAPGDPVPKPMPDAGPKPLLVTGLPRSGTSWAGKMLAAGGGLVYVNEPLNPQHPPGLSPGILNAVVTHRFQYICRENEESWLSAFADTVALRYRFLAELRRNRSPYDLARMGKYGTSFTVGRLLRRRALLDDPFALFSTAWFCERLGCRAVVLIRDPVALVGSWRRLGWSVEVRELLDQPLLVRDHPVVLRLRDADPDPIAATAALWSVAHRVVTDLAAAHDGIRLVRYEDLARDPLGGYRELYDWCGLPWSAKAAARIRRACSGTASADRPFHRTGLSRTAFRAMDSAAHLSSWRDRLTPDEIARVARLTMRSAGPPS
ncbi:sulfotransferase [Thermopolyspora sp. NPDC052614]|uniref:sulfotransferase n=1 Tax=Thermopolyspora sp. NPDC052614 TaxID=3155682 RepID=UPI003423E742